MKLLESTKSKITKNGNDENANYQQNPGVFYTFTPNKSFGQLFDISPKNKMFKTFDSYLYFHILKCDLLNKILNLEIQKIE